MLHKLIYAFLLLTCLSGYSQKVVNNVARVGIINPGISYEAAVGPKSTFYSELGLAPYIGFSSGTYGGTEDAVFRMDPMAYIQYRAYYNYKQRSEKKLRTDLNSLNYIAPALGMSYSKNPIRSDGYDEPERRLLGSVGVYWGMQRNYKSRFSLDIMVGPAYEFGSTTNYNGMGGTTKESDGKFTVNSRLILGIWLNKKQ